MLVDVADDEIIVTLRPLEGRRMRLSITYPADSARHRNRVLTAVADLIRPPGAPDPFGDTKRTSK
jgi:hypothetical protein